MLAGLMAGTAQDPDPTGMPNVREAEPDTRYNGWIDSLELIWVLNDSWRPLDSFYRSTIAGNSNRDLVNQVIFFMSIEPDSFAQTAPPDILSFYLDEATSIDFNINLRLLIPMLHRVEPFIGRRRTADMAHAFYEKNTAFWAANFPPETTSYLEMNEIPLETLRTWEKE
jgi:hypothetical protein